MLPECFLLKRYYTSRIRRAYGHRLRRMMSAWAILPCQTTVRCNSESVEDSPTRSRDSDFSFPVYPAGRLQGTRARHQRNPGRPVVRMDGDRRKRMRPLEARRAAYRRSQRAGRRAGFSDSEHATGRRRKFETGLIRWTVRGPDARRVAAQSGRAFLRRFIENTLQRVEQVQIAEDSPQLTTLGYDQAADALVSNNVDSERD